MEGPIRTWQDTPALTTLTASFQGCLTVAALQRALPVHYLTASAAPTATTDVDLFKLTRLPPSALRPTLAHLQGGVGNAESGSNDNADLQVNA